jgi:hypothetical protein
METKNKRAEQLTEIRATLKRLIGTSKRVEITLENGSTLHGQLKRNGFDLHGLSKGQICVVNSNITPIKSKEIISISVLS